MSFAVFIFILLDTFCCLFMIGCFNKFFQTNSKKHVFFMGIVWCANIKLITPFWIGFFEGLFK